MRGTLLAIWLTFWIARQLFTIKHKFAVLVFKTIWILVALYAIFLLLGFKL